MPKFELITNSTNSVALQKWGTQTMKDTWQMLLSNGIRLLEFGTI